MQTIRVVQGAGSGDRRPETPGAAHDAGIHGPDPRLRVSRSSGARGFPLVDLTGNGIERVRQAFTLLCRQLVPEPLSCLIRVIGDCRGNFVERLTAVAASLPEVVHNRQQDVELPKPAQSLCDAAKTFPDFSRRVALQFQDRHHLTKTTRGDARLMKRLGIACVDPAERAYRRDRVAS